MNIFRQIIFLISIGVTITFISVSIQSCNSDSDESLNTKTQNTEKYEYLTCYENDVFSEKGMKLLSKALQRIGDNFIIENDTCYLTVHSAKDLNMSDYLFSIIEQSVNNTNMKYKIYQLFKDNNIEITIKNPFEINKQIITTRVEVESAFGNQWSNTTYTLTHTEVITVINAMRSSNGSVSTFASIISTAFPGGTAASTLIALYGYFNDSKFSKIQDEYAKSGSTNGITLRELSTMSPTGLPFTTYGWNINK